MCAAAAPYYPAHLKDCLKGLEKDIKVRGGITSNIVWLCSPFTTRDMPTLFYTEETDFLYIFLFIL